MRTVFSLIIVMVLWGSAFTSSKVAIAAVGYEVAGSLRFLLGAAVLLLVLPFAGRPGPGRDGRNWLALTGLGLVGVFGYNLLFFLGLSLAPATDGSMIIPVLSPVITTALSVLLGHRRLASTQVLGLGAAVLGAATYITGAPAEPGSGHRIIGDALFVAAAACWSTYTVLGRPILGRLAAQRVSTYTTAIGALALGLVASPFVGDVDVARLDGVFWLNMAYLAILPTALAYVLYYRAVHRLGATTAATMMFLVPVVGMVCGIVLLHESINPTQVVGSIMMLGGAFLATRTPKRTQTAPTPEPSRV
jgi:drug/metabolite transporter (DMT)-like permease